MAAYNTDHSQPPLDSLDCGGLDPILGRANDPDGRRAKVAGKRSEGGLLDPAWGDMFAGDTPPAAIPSERRTLFLSATIALEVDHMGDEL